MAAKTRAALERMHLELRVAKLERAEKQARGELIEVTAVVDMIEARMAPLRQIIGSLPDQALDALRSLRLTAPARARTRAAMQGVVDRAGAEIHDLLSASTRLRADAKTTDRTPAP